jgi:CubicO group peptidase (beta-lactamase class C family)
VVAENTAGVGSLTTDQALFDIGSAAKSITAAAVLLLAQHGLLDVADSITRYLPDVPAADRAVTVMQLLSHTSGLPENFSPDTARLGRVAAIRAILALPRGKAGTFSYSNAGYTLLAAIVEAATHQPFRVVVQKQLLEPAGMTRTGWYGEPPPDVTPVHGHVHGRDTGPAGTQAPASWATLGAGGMTSTAADMARWLKAIASESILSSTSTRLMFKARAPLGQPGASVAYGWVVGQTRAGPIRLVGGETDYGYTTDLRMLPRQSLMIVTLSCSTTATANEIGHELQVAET